MFCVLPRSSLSAGWNTEKTIMEIEMMMCPRCGRKVSVNQMVGEMCEDCNAELEARYELAQEDYQPSELIYA